MSSKINWIDMSGSESDEQHHHHHHHHEEPQEQELPPQPLLNKVVSSPLPDKRNANEQQNLNKLQNCKNQKIWLYAPLFYRDNVDDVDKILRSDQNIKKIDKFSKGWNVLTTKQNARQYIVEGKKEGKFFIKFYFSNKNQQSQTNRPYDNYRNNNYDSDGRKLKYMPKSPNSRGDVKQMKSPQGLRRIESTQEQVAGRTPKSPTYKAKEWKKYDDSRDYRQKYTNNNKQTYKREDREREQSDSLGKDRDYRPKYTKKNSREQQYSKGNQYVPESPKKKYVQKKESQPKVQTPVPPKEAPIQKTEQAKVQLVTPEENSEQTLSTPNEKKPKKKNKKKNQLLNDSNNPFSLLNGI